MAPDSASAPSASDLKEERRRLRRLRVITDLTAGVLMHERLSRRQAEEIVAAARARILEMFPDKEDTYELILAPRFRRLMDQYVGPDIPDVT